jgi:site-specific DNA-methyltransferase (adenine-specific)
MTTQTPPHVESSAVLGPDGLALGIKPYYQDAAVTIYHGDCRNIITHLRDIDVVCTDPPYGMAYKSNYRKGGNPFGEIQGDKLYDFEVLANLISLARCAVYAFGRWDNLRDMPPPKSVLAWVKNNWSMGDLEHEYARQWEMCAFYAKDGHEWAKGRPQDVIMRDRVNPNGMQHPTEKPVSLLTKLLSDTKCSTVLDPYMGSGSTLCAAKDLGKRAIGIEIEERYCEVAARRLAQDVLDLGA